MNLLKLASTALFLFSVTSAADFKPTIVGGTEAAPGEFPYIVSLQESTGHICGGSLIKKNWVLTAGHCVSGTSLTKVYIGLHDQKNKSGTEAMKIKQIIRHPDYDSSNIDYDFALIELSKDSAFEPVEINTQEIQISDEAGKQIMSTVAGWGEMNARSAADLLQKVDVPLATKELCEKGYPGNITDRMICAGYPAGEKDACYGDSGGPLIVHDSTTNAPVLVGVVSWGEGCARADKLGVYSKVNAVADWIKTTAQ